MYGNAVIFASYTKMFRMPGRYCFLVTGIWNFHYEKIPDSANILEYDGY